MVASWVSQASFTPPGFTVAVAKDRAVETLLHVGDAFTLSVLAEARQRARWETVSAAVSARRRPLRRPESWRAAPRARPVFAEADGLR